MYTPYRNCPLEGAGTHRSEGGACPPPAAGARLGVGGAAGRRGAPLGVYRLIVKMQFCPSFAKWTDYNGNWEIGFLWKIGWLFWNFGCDIFVMICCVFVLGVCILGGMLVPRYD